ncbi:MAG: hypothetical protein JKY45_06915 [Emcibacter sp.]|nr:hypothetical protein [Emcibacter sp.]
MLKQVTLSYRLAVASRVVAAVMGSYCLATMATLVLTYALPAGRAQGLLMGMMLSFSIYAAAIVWVFSVRTAMYAWGGLLAITIALGCVYILIRPGAMT